ncbi:MAG: hypothetical protein ABSF23_17885 [Terracidiphilus sp.]|jgi:hypothetical protein
MRAEKTPADDVSADQRQWLRWGGIAALALAVGYIVIIPLYAHVGAPPNGGDAWFRYLPGKITIWWTILGISVFTDLLYIPFALSLNIALRSVNKYAMLLAVAFMGLFVVLDLAITWTHYASILALYQNYAAATDDARRAGYLAAAEYASAVLATPLEIVYAIVTLSIGILLTGIVMLKATFSRIAAWLGLATGVLGLLSLTGSYLAIMGNALFATVWLFFVGFRLIRLARQSSAQFPA